MVHIDLARALTEGDYDLRVRLLNSIEEKQLFDRRLQRAIVSCLSDPEITIRMLAARAATGFNCPDHQTLTALATALVDDSEYVVDWMFDAIQTMYVDDATLLAALRKALAKSDSVATSRANVAQVLALRNGDASLFVGGDFSNPWEAMCVLRTNPQNSEAYDYLLTHGLHDESATLMVQAAIELWVLREESQAWNALELALDAFEPGSGVCRVLEKALRGPQREAALSVLERRFHVRFDADAITDLGALLLFVLEGAGMANSGIPEELGEWARLAVTAWPNPPPAFLQALRRASSRPGAAPNAVHADTLWQKRAMCQ